MALFIFGAMEADGAPDAEGPALADSPTPAAAVAAAPYDRTLTPAHMYLESERSALNTNAAAPLFVSRNNGSGVLLLPLLRLREVVVFPGEDVPLRLVQRDTLSLVHILVARERESPLRSLFGEREERMDPQWRSIAPVLRGTRTFGVVARGKKIGTAVEICSIGSDAEGWFVLCRGTLRFELAWGQAPHPLVSRVRIVSDQMPGRIPRAAFDGRFQVSRWPRSVWRRFDPATVAAHLRTTLQTSSLRLDPPAEYGPAKLAYWASANLPIDCATRQLLLEAPTFLLRCQMIREICCSPLGNMSCAVCNQVVARKADVISLSDNNNNSGTFVNPGGAVHQMLTLASTQNLRTTGSPETAHSWFPGYAWTILNCGTCGNHMGWRFDALPQPLDPPFFYGIRHAALQYNDQPEPAQRREEAPPRQQQPGSHAHLLRTWWLAARRRLADNVESQGS